MATTFTAFDLHNNNNVYSKVYIILSSAVVVTRIVHGYAYLCYTANDRSRYAIAFI